MAKKKKLPTWATTVTPFSKFLALCILVIFPILGFYFGIYYQKQMDDYKQDNEMIVYKTSNTCAQPPDGQVACRTNKDCPSNYYCGQSGPMRADKQNHKSCFKNGDAMPM